TNAVAWITSCIRATRAWFEATESPVTIAWSANGRGMSVRWNVVGALIAATRSPAWSARAPKLRENPIRATTPPERPADAPPQWHNSRRTGTATPGPAMALSVIEIGTIGTIQVMGDDLYYDPYDFEVDTDPYPVWRRMREEQPLYYNEKYDFFALSRFDDVEQGLIDWDTYRSGKGSVLELIRAEFEMPPGMILMEDPPIHDLHRALLSRVFTPKKMLAIEPKVREFCARSLDPLVGSGGFDFIGDLGAQMPMRTIGMLLGIPEQDQEA